jgi:hypothetical protein
VSFASWFTGGSRYSRAYMTLFLRLLISAIASLGANLDIDTFSKDSEDGA